MFAGLQLNKANLQRLLTGLSGFVFSWSGGSTGLTPSSPASGAVQLGGVLNVAHGGTGVTTPQAASESLNTNYVVDTLADLKGLTSRPLIVRNQYRSLPGDRGGGVWMFRTGDQSANVTADPESGVWAAPDSDSTGASGAWQRQYDGDLFFSWFGPPVGDAFDCTEVFSRFLESAKSLGKDCRMDRGHYRITDTVVLSNYYGKLEGAGRPLTNSDPDGTMIIVDTGDKNGLELSRCPFMKITGITFSGPLTTARLTGGALLRVKDSSSFFSLEHMQFQRGYRLIHAGGETLPGGLYFNLTDVRGGSCSGDFAFSSKVDDPTEFKAHDGCQWDRSSWGSGDIYQRFNGDDVTSVFNSTLFIKDVNDAQITLINRGTYAHLPQEVGVDVTVVQSINGITITFPAPVSEDYWVEVTRVQPVWGDPDAEYTYPINVWYDGSVSHKHNDTSVNFGGDGYVIENSRLVSQAGLCYWSGGGVENVRGDAMRASDGANNIQLSNFYLSSDRDCLYAPHDPALDQAIASIAEYMDEPGNLVLVETTTPHGLTNDTDPTSEFFGFVPAAIFVSGFTNVVDGAVNGAWKVKVTDTTHFVLWNDWRAPFTPSRMPLSYGGTGVWRSRFPGFGAIVASNMRIRGAGRNNVFVDAPNCSFSNSNLSPAGRYNRNYWGLDIVSFADNGSGKVRVTLQSPHRLRAQYTCRLDGVLKASVPQFNTTADVSRIDIQSSTVIDLIDLNYDGPYDTTTELLPAFLQTVGAPILVGENGFGLTISDCNMGDIRQSEESHWFGLINNCEDRIDVVGCNLADSKVAPILNWTPDPRQVFALNNDGVSQTTARQITWYNDGAGNISGDLFGAGTPEATVVGYVGMTYRDRTNGLLYFKASGDGTNTSWVLLASLSLPQTFSAAQVIEVADDTNPALRVTQTGAGPALLVEDFTHPDSTAFTVLNNGTTVVGSTTAQTMGGTNPHLQLNGNTINTGTFGVGSWAIADTTSARVILAKSGNPVIGDHTAVVASESLGTIQFEGSDGTGFIPAASITGTVSAGTTVATNDVPGTLLFGTTADGAAAITGRWSIDHRGFLRVLSGSFGLGAPITKTGDFTLADTENWIINNKAGSACVVTLPAASAWPGRQVMIKNIQAQAVDSASSNVVPLAGGAAGTVIVSNTAGRWVTLVSDGTNWVAMAGVI